MECYICDLYGNSNWHLPSNEIANRTFNTELEAKQWFQEKYPNGELLFSGFHLTEHYTTNWVFCDGKEIGEITLESHSQK